MTNSNYTSKSWIASFDHAGMYLLVTMVTKAGFQQSSHQRCFSTPRSTSLSIIQVLWSLHLIIDMSGRLLTSLAILSASLSLCGHCISLFLLVYVESTHKDLRTSSLSRTSIRKRGNRSSKQNYNSLECLRPIWGARPHARTWRGHQLCGQQKQLRP